MTKHTNPDLSDLLYEDPDIHRRRWFVLGIMGVSLVLVVMSVSGLNVALPSIQRDLSATNSQLQWIIDSYALVFAGLLLSAGAIGDRFGRRRALLGGLTVFALGAALGSLGETAGQVVVGRTIMGVGAALIMPATLSLITAVFPPEERRTAIAMWAGFAGAGGAIGPVVSGGLLEGFWWGSALLVNIPVVAGLMAAVVFAVPESRDPETTPLDPAGAVLSLVGVTALVYAIIEGPEEGWTSPWVLTGFVAAVAALGAFIAWERRSPHPMLPIRYFRDLRFSVGAAVITIAFFAMFGFFFLNGLYLQFVRGYSPLLAGVSTLPLAAMLVIVAPRSAALAERFGSGPVISTGFSSIGLGFFLLSLVGPTSPFLLLAAAYVCLGAGMGVTVAPATGGVMSAVPQAKAGVGSAVNDTTRELGGALGIAVLGSIVTSTYRSGLDLDGLRLPPDAASAVEESVGAAGGIAARLPDGSELVARAGSAFTDAFNTTSLLCAMLAVVAGIVVRVVFRPDRERAAYESAPPPPTPAQAPAGAPEPAVEKT